MSWIEYTGNWKPDSEKDAQPETTVTNGVVNEVKKPNEEIEQTLEVRCHCMKNADIVRVVLALSPLEPPLRNLFCKREQLPRIPMRLACVLDVSHSMAEPYGPSDENESAHSSREGNGDAMAEGVSKLDRVKRFARLLVGAIGNEDQLAIITFGTTAEVVVPLKRMTEEVQRDALAAIDSIDLRGVTNMSAGIFAAIEQFNVAFAKSRFFNDNILLFTDGMANEGLVDSADLVREIKKKLKLLRDECHFESDYLIKFATLGTGGFLAEQLYTLGQEFSSDAFYFIDENASLELDLMTPVLLRQSGAVANVKVVVDTLNGVTLDRTDQCTEYLIPGGGGDVASSGAGAIRGGEGGTKGGGKGKDLLPPIGQRQETYLINDIATDMTRHITFSARLPKKHKKLLKGKDVIKVDVHYKDSLMCARTSERTVSYAELPVKDKLNVEVDVIEVARQECRRRTVKALERASALVAKLDRTKARSTLVAAVDDIQTYTASTTTEYCTCEETQAELDAWTDKLVLNLQHCERFVGDFSVRWDDAWGRIKALQSSISREVPSTRSIYSERAELFEVPRVNSQLSDLSDRLRDIYLDLGLSPTSLKRYHIAAPPPPRKSGDDDFDDVDDVRDVNEYNHVKEFSETCI